MIMTVVFEDNGEACTMDRKLIQLSVRERTVIELGSFKSLNSEVISLILDQLLM